MEKRATARLLRKKLYTFHYTHTHAILYFLVTNYFLNFIRVSDIMQIKLHVNHNMKMQNICAQFSKPFLQFYSNRTLVHIRMNCFINILKIKDEECLSMSLILND